MLLYVQIMYIHNAQYCDELKNIENSRTSKNKKTGFVTLHISRMNNLHYHVNEYSKLYNATDTFILIRFYLKNH